jgi:hypothetical protein
MLHRAHVLPIASDGTLNVSGTISVSAFTGVATSAKQDSLLAFTKRGNKLFGDTDTITTRTDTTTFTGATKFLEGTIEADDSIQVSINGSFPAGQVWTIVETTPLNISWSAETSTKLYVKRYGGAGTPRFYIRISGR